MRKIRKNQKGFSLIELIVAMAILFIVSAAIFEFVIVASRHYQKETREVNLQYEAQLTMNQLQDLLIDATRGVTYSVNGGTEKILSDSEITVTGITSKQLTVYNTDRYYIVKWVASDGRLLYSEYSREADGSFTEITRDVLMAEYIHDFAADLTDLENGSSIRLDIVFDNGRTYEVAQNVTLRNRVSVNAAESELYSN